MRASGTKVLQTHLQPELGSTFWSSPPCVIRAPNCGFLQMTLISCLQRSWESFPCLEVVKS